MIELADSKKHLIVKRNGSIEPFNSNKLTQVLLWACDNNQYLVNNILEAIDIKIYNRMDIRTLYDEVMDTVDNMTTRLTPIYNEVYKKLYIQKTYKEYHKIKRSEYPDYFIAILKPLIDANVIIDITKYFTIDEINSIGKMIVPSRDFDSTAIGLQTFFKKNSKKINNKPIELLQHGFMRLAIQAFLYEPNKKLRMELINKRYDDLSTFVYTEATPKWLNSLTSNFQAASCCLHQMDDSIESINTTINNISQYSKYGGGNAVDVSSLRAKGSTIGSNGTSSGPIPFIKMIESSINAYNQLGCYSEDTEILTAKGWKLFSELKQTDLVAQFNYNRSIDFTNFSEYYEYDVGTNANMIHYTMQSKKYVDLLVTPNHRTVKLITPSNKIYIDQAEYLEYASDNHMLVAGTTYGNKIFNAIDQLKIAYQADGGCFTSVNGKLKNRYAYFFHFKKQRKINRLLSILQQIKYIYPDVEYKCRNNSKDNSQYIDVYIPCNHAIKLEKDFNWINLTEINTHYGQSFIEELRYWDGRINKKSIGFVSTNKNVIDTIQAIAALSNYRSTVNELTKEKDHHSQAYELNITRTSTIGSASKSRKPERGILKSTVKYTGKVYCVTVPSGMLVVRRNNKVAISGNSRPGACVVTTNWWHHDIKQILELKDEGGVEAERARNLQYSIKINRLFLNRIKKDEDISLFDPKLVPDLLTTYGKEFEDLYTKYENDPTIPRTTISARDLAYLIAKIRVETGNLYIFFTENANESTPFKQLITQSNLCTEIFLPTTAAKPKTTKIVTDMTTSEITTIEESETGLLALCNLSSINIVKWMSMSNKQRYISAYNLLRASDNLIDYQYYPVKDGEHFNRNYRAIGIGMNNLAYYFAKNDIKFSEPKALIEMEKISKSIKDIFTQASENLALERGNFLYYHKTNLTRPARFATLFAIAPTASSALVIGATEGIEPVNQVLVEKTGTYSAKQLAPEAQALWNKYENAFDIPTKCLYDLAAVRQSILLDQGQSINTYVTNTNSAYEIISDIIYAEHIGLKSLYYLQSKNTKVEKGCESCGS